MPSSLQPELWALVLEHLRQTLPAPHTGISLPRSAIRQSGLAASLRISKQMYNLAAPILYRIAVTDSIRSFAHVGAMTIDGIIPKIDLLNRVQQLFLESPKRNYYEQCRAEEIDEDDREYYAAILERGGVFNTLPDQEYAERDVTLFPREAEEVKEDLRSARHLRMKNLRTLSVGAFFGHEEEALHRRRHLTKLCFDRDLAGELLECRSLLSALINNNPSILHYCESLTSGPLSIHDSVAEHRATITLHSNKVLCGFDPYPNLPFNQWRWYQHEINGWATQPGRYTSRAACRKVVPLPITSAIQHAVVFGRRSAGDMQPHAPPQTPSRTIGIYPRLRDCARPRESNTGSRQMLDTLSRPKTESEREEWRNEAARAATAAAVVLAESSRERAESSRERPDDSDIEVKIELLQLFDAPACQACMWRYER